MGKTTDEINKAGQASSDAVVQDMFRVDPFAIDKAQNAAIEEAKSILQSFDTGTPNVNQTTGANQRLRIHVPTPAKAGTTVTMGEPFEGVSHCGFGVATDGHINLTASEATSAVTIVGNSQVLVQSVNSTLYLVSADTAMIASAKDTSLLAAGGLTIAAGWAPDEPWSGVTGREPVAKAADGYLKKMGEIQEYWGKMDGRVAVANIARSVAVDLCGTTWWEKGYSAFGVWVDYEDFKADPQINLFAPNGYLFGTDKFAAMYAGVGIDIAAPGVSIMGLLDAEVFAVQGAGLTGGRSASVSGLLSASVVSYQKGTEIASRLGSVEVYGKTIQIGSNAAAPVGFRQLLERASQEPTSEIKVEATTRIGVATKGALEISEADGIHLVSHDALTHRAAKAVDVSAGEKLRLWAGGPARKNTEVEDPGLYLDSNKRSVSLRVLDTEVALDPDNLVVRRGADASSPEIRMTSSEISVGFGSAPSKLIRFKSDGSMTFGQAIKIK